MVLEMGTNRNKIITHACAYSMVLPMLTWASNISDIKIVDTTSSAHQDSNHNPENEEHIPRITNALSKQSKRKVSE